MLVALDQIVWGVTDDVPEDDQYLKQDANGVGFAVRLEQPDDFTDQAMICGFIQKWPRADPRFKIVVTGLLRIRLVPLFAGAIDEFIQVVVLVGELAVGRAG